jgi:hypothetical protein
MGLEMDEIKTRIIEGINEFKEEYQKYVYDYLYESDIQSRLFCILREKLHREVKQVESSKGQQKKLNLIYSGYSNGVKDRIDLVCLDPKINFDNKSFPEVLDPLYNQPLLVGIEIKYIYSGYQNLRDIGGSMKDLKKLKEYKPNYAKRFIEPKNFQYLAICFIQNQSSRCFNVIKDQIELCKSHCFEQYDRIYVITDKEVYKVKDGIQ